MSGVLLLALAAVPLVLWYAYSRAVYWRFKQHKDLPQPKQSLIWGHLKIMGETLNKGHSKRHTDYAFTEIVRSLPNNPGFCFFDMRPVMWPVVLISSHEVAEQVSKSTSLYRYSTPKSPTIHTLDALVGESSIIAIGGEPWKHMRKRFNGGFAPHHLHTLLPQLIDKTKIFISRLDEHAKAGTTFEFEELCTTLTFDIIGAVTMNEEYNAQLPLAQQGPFVRNYRALLKTFHNDFLDANWLTAPRTMYRRRKYGRLVDDHMKRSIQSRWDEYKAAKDKGHQSSDRSVLALSFDAIDEMTPEALRETADQLKTFLLAGHDTTSILLQWSFYELSRSPRILENLRAELDHVLGPDADPAAVSDAFLNGGEDIISKLSYLSAFIKEILRLYPPAGSARMVPSGSGFVLKTPEGRFCVDNMVLYNCHYAIQRDPAVYGDTADLFMPERWLGNTSTTSEEYAKTHQDHSAQTVPTTAWRPFERGPRNCIGQELSNLEARVILATTARRYNFHKTGMGSLALKDGKPFLNNNGQYEITEPLINTRQVTSKPIDGMMMRVEFHKA